MTTLNEVESYMIDMYLSNCKEETENNKKKYIINSLSLNLPFQLDKIDLKKSNIHGFGCFAKTKIFKGELITFFPADVIEYKPDGDKIINNKKTYIFSSMRFEKTNGKVKHNEFNRKKYRDLNYSYQIDEFYKIYSTSYFNSDPNYLGHFINDGAKSNSSNKSNDIYNKISDLKSNCKYYNFENNLHIAIISTRDIEIGEELLITYGCNYWYRFNNI